MAARATPSASMVAMCRVVLPKAEGRVEVLSGWAHPAYRWIFGLVVPGMDWHGGQLG